jgi:hypothetical protein
VEESENAVILVEMHAETTAKKVIAKTVMISTKKR